jgi:hypothetical protein
VSGRLKNFMSESRRGTLINTGLQSGVSSAGRTQNRFNGLAGLGETVKTVSIGSAFFTGLKPGVDGNSHFALC